MSMTEFYNADAFDLDLVCSHLEEVERDALERTRHLMWAMLAPNSKTKIQPNDVLKFSWETNKTGQDTTPTTKEMYEEAFKNFKNKKK